VELVIDEMKIFVLNQRYWERLLILVILYEDQCQRGRADGEVIQLLQEGLVGASKTKKIEAIRGEFLAIDAAVNQLQPNDLCLILIDQVEESLKYIGELTQKNH
jgi:cyanophycin synthetase